MSARVIAIQLRAWRGNLGISQQAAAGRLGVPLAAYVAWEDGKPCRFAALVENQIGVPVAFNAQLEGRTVHEAEQMIKRVLS
jgi:transcriptional regulator with XRE-family HTH domain